MAIPNADLFCKIPYKNGITGETREYSFGARDITVGRLRQMKAWYGPEYGAYLTFVQLFLQGDADAIACALWICLSKDGVNKEPKYIDFEPYDIFQAIQAQNKVNAELEEAEALGDPQTGVVSVPVEPPQSGETIPASDVTPTPSATSTSGS